MQFILVDEFSLKYLSLPRKTFFKLILDLLYSCVVKPKMLSINKDIAITTINITTVIFLKFQKH